MNGLDLYPEFRAYIYPDATDVSVEPRGNDTFLVTMRGEDGGQILLKKEGDKVEIVAADNVDHALAAPPACAGECTPQALSEQLARCQPAAIGCLNEEPVSLFQQFARGNPPRRDDVRRCCQSNGHLSPVSAGIPNRVWR